MIDEKSYLSKVTIAVIPLLFGLCQTVKGQIILVKAGKSNFQIVIPDKPTKFEQRASEELKSYINQTTKANLAIIPESITKQSNKIFIGNTKAAQNIHATKGVKDDGYAIIYKSNNIYILGNQGKGTLYGTNSFLERFFGIDYLSATVITIPNLDKVTISQNTNIVSNPAFITRDNFTDMGYNGKWNGNEKEYIGGYKDWHCINHVFLDWDKESQWGLFGHTFFRIVPPQTYFSAHPEYYSLIDGKRQTQQLNLSNPALAQVVIDNLKKMMYANPSQIYWMIGQEDVGKWCECDSCQKAYQKYGNKKSGLMIEFINKIAKAFPNKQIATFAYAETEPPPQNIKPDSNVIVVNAPYGAHHNAALNSDENSQWNGYIKQWKKITDKQMIWDYYANFVDILAPYPDLSTMSQNFKFYKSLGVKHIFAQRPVFLPGSDMEELKAYVISKLLWNPSLNQDSLVTSFTDRYYGAAGKYIVQYLNAMTSNMKKTGAVLLTQEDALTYSKTFLSPTYIKQYNQILDNAVSSQVDLLNRLNSARFGLDYITVKMLKTNGRSSLASLSESDVNQIKDRFKNSVKRMNVKFTADASQKPIDQYLNVSGPTNNILKTAAASAALCGGISLIYYQKRKRSRKKLYNTL